MRQAKQVAAHVTSFFEIDLTRIANLRANTRAAFEAETGQKLTFLPFIIRAVVENLRRHPVLNATVSGTDAVPAANDARVQRSTLSGAGSPEATPSV